MPFKNEAAMKEALNGLEQAVGEGKWTRKLFAKVARRMEPIMREVLLERPDPQQLTYIEPDVRIIEEGVAFCALGTIDNDAAVALEKWRIKRSEFESRIAMKTGLNLHEMQETMKLNDDCGYEAVLDYWRSLGFDEED